MAFSPVDRFRSVAKILIDVRLQELVDENRKLKLALFWKTYGIRQLRERVFSSIQRRINCKCWSCRFGKMFNDEQECHSSGDDECAVMHRFEQIASDHGLTVATENFSDIVPAFYEELGEEDDEAQIFCNGDVHIVLPSSFTDWVVLGYGEKLSQAKSTEDPELIKLKMLFQTMENM